MANEILVWDGDGDGVYRLVFFIPITAKKAGAIPTPAPRDAAGQLAEWAIAANAQAPAIVAALDDGSMVYRIVRLRKEAGLTAAQLTARVREVYAATKADVEGWYTIAYQHFGAWLNAV